MKKYLSEILLFFIITISIISCENNFTPVINFKKQYALNCIIRGDTALQYAAILQSFVNENFNKESAFISGAVLKLNYDGRDYFFSDTSSGVPDNIRYYYLKNLNLEKGKQLKIEADLPDGTVLKSSTQTPDPGILIFEGDKNIPPDNLSDVFSINWRLFNYDGESLYYKPFLYIEYRKYVNGTMVYMKKEVPVQYNLVNEKFIPVYPAISMNNSIEYPLDAINKTLKDLQETDSVSNHDILNANFVLWIFDKNLATYISSTEGFQEDFSLRIEAADFTNVQGGYGIFGSFLKYETNIQFNPYALKLSGY
ncbi:MAG: hypothetical protein WCE54_00860 [Ignavibacteriaceae bacterium]